MTTFTIPGPAVTPARRPVAAVEHRAGSGGQAAGSPPRYPAATNIPAHAGSP